MTDLTKEEQQAREAWGKLWGRQYYDAVEMLEGKNAFQARLLEELEKMRQTVFQKRDSLESYHVDYDDWTNEIVFLDDIIELVKTLTP